MTQLGQWDDPYNERSGGYPQEYGRGQDAYGRGQPAYPQDHGRGQQAYPQDYGRGHEGYAAPPPAAPARRQNRPAPVRGERRGRGGRGPSPARGQNRPARGQQPPMGYRGGPGGPQVEQAPTGRRGRKSTASRRRAQAREMRWNANRLAVPYYTDGPKITFGILWFVAVGAAAFLNTWGLAVVAASVAGLAGLQAGRAWFPQFGPTKWWTAGAAFVVGISGVIGPLGLVAGAGMGMVLLLAYIALNPVHARSTGELLDVLMRSSLPAGIAAGSLVALRDVTPGAVLLLIALVSAYEAGDFLIGSGSSNAVEGPVSGLVALGAVAFVFWIVPPRPFTTTSILLFAALAGVCCPLGQIVAAGLLPRGSAWAPALRRIDSYLLAAPLWLVLLWSVSGTSTL